MNKRHKREINPIVNETINGAATASKSAFGIPSLASFVKIRIKVTTGTRHVSELAQHRLNMEVDLQSLVGIQVS
jgi:hypothetical protein